jgi:tetratricopeptide (TPR) repeat protein
MRKIKDLRASDFPGVDPKKFDEWKQAALDASKKQRVVWIVLGLLNLILIFTGVGVFLGGFLLLFILFLIARTPNRLLKEAGLTHADIRRAARRSIGVVQTEELTKKCPQCAELIKAEALVCRFCGYTFKPEEAQEQIAKIRKETQATRAALEMQHSMNWKLIFYLSTFGLLTGVASVFRFPIGFSIALLFMVWIGIAVLIVKKAQGKYFKHGFMVGVFSGVINSLVQFILFPIYLKNYPEIMQGFTATQSSSKARFMQLFSGIVASIFLGLIPGFFAWVAGKIIKKKGKEAYTFSPIPTSPEPLRSVEKIPLKQEQTIKWLPPIESKYLRATFAQLEQDSGPGGSQFKEAIQYWNREEFEKAFELFEQAFNLGLTPTYKCGAHSFLGQIHLKRGKLDLAVDQLLKCLEIQQKVASAAWETAIRLYIIYNEAGMYQYANSLRSVADAANTRGLYLTADTENEIRELVKQWLKKTDAKIVEKESSGDVSQILLPFESVSLQKICAVCGESVSQDAIQCPKCGRGIFETQKSYNEASVESLRATLNAEALGKIKEVTMNADFGRLENSKAEPSALTIGKRLNGARYNVSNYASKSGRAGKCRDCGAIVKLTDAKEVCHDWDGVDAYHFYCPSCYVPSEYYKGQLLGADGKPVIDQHSWYYE